MRFPEAFDLLEERLKSSNEEDVAASAIALSGFADDVLRKLNERTRILLARSQPLDEPGKVVLGSACGAIEAIITAMELQSHASGIASTLLEALKLGLYGRTVKLCVSARQNACDRCLAQVRVLELPRSSYTESERASFAYSAEQLAPGLPRTEDRAVAVSVFQALLEDRSESPKVIRPAASALGRLLQNDATGRRAILALQKRIADSCDCRIVSFSRTKFPAAKDGLMTLLKEDVAFCAKFCRMGSEASRNRHTKCNPLDSTQRQAFGYPKTGVLRFEPSRRGVQYKLARKENRTRMGTDRSWSLI